VTVIDIRFRRPHRMRMQTWVEGRCHFDLQQIKDKQYFIYQSFYWK
jgi:hypothetical protein